MRFTVPKFIDVEDKIFGPLTFKQFIYLLGGAGGSVLAFWIIPVRILALPVAGVIIALSLSLAFWKFNGRSFIHTVQAVFNYLTKTRTYVWKEQDHEKSQKQIKKELNQIENVMQSGETNQIRKKSHRTNVQENQFDNSKSTDKLAREGNNSAK